MSTTTFLCAVGWDLIQRWVALSGPLLQLMDIGDPWATWPGEHGNRIIKFTINIGFHSSRSQSAFATSGGFLHIFGGYSRNLSLPCCPAAKLRRSLWVDLKVGVNDTAFLKKNEYFYWMNNQIFWMNIFWINNQFYFWMNILLNEYFRFDFELNIELNHFLARFNVWMNNQNKLNSASGVQRGEVSEGDFSPCFWESFPYSLSYSTLFTGFHSTFWNNIILNCF